MMNFSTTIWKWRSRRKLWMTIFQRSWRATLTTWSQQLGRKLTQWSSPSPNRHPPTFPSLPFTRFSPPSINLSPLTLVWRRWTSFTFSVWTWRHSCAPYRCKMPYRHSLQYKQSSLRSELICWREGPILSFYVWCCAGSRRLRIEDSLNFCDSWACSSFSLLPVRRIDASKPQYISFSNW